MGRSKILIPVGELKKLYHTRGLSPQKIAALFGCTSVTVRHRLIEANIPLKTKSAAQNRYAKKDYRGTETDKAYMLGFRYGDLNVYKPKGASKTIVVRSHTTHSVQERVFNRLFGRYGKITTSKSGRNIHSTCYLNESFSFLLDKYPTHIRTWIHSNASWRWAFAAGYSDAEATFGLNQGKGRFKIDAYDREILDDLHELFLRSEIKSKFQIIARKGENDYGWVWKHDVWRISVNEAASLEKLVRHLRPFLRHEKRKRDAGIVERNILLRRKHGTIK